MKFDIATSGLSRVAIKHASSTLVIYKYRGDLFLRPIFPAGRKIEWYSRAVRLMRRSLKKRALALRHHLVGISFLFAAERRTHVT